VAQQNNTNMQLESRVGRLEGAMETLATEVKTTSENVREISKSMTGFKEEILARLGTIAAPKWPMIIGVVSLLITILGLGGTIIAMMISGQRDAIETLKNNIGAMNSCMYNERYETGQTSVVKAQLTDNIKQLHDDVADLQKWRYEHERDSSACMGETKAKLESLSKH
jgi:hypothetical protein